MSYVKAASLLQKGISKPSLFSVKMPNRKVSNSTNEHLDFFCLSTAIPEVRLNTVVVGGHEYMGIERDQPTQIIFGKPFTLQIIERSDFGVYKQMRDWLNQTAFRANQGGTEGQATGLRSTRMAYQNTYVEDFSLSKLEYANGIDVDQFFDEDRNRQLVGYRTVMKVNFIRAFPVAIQAVNLSSESRDAFTTFQVDFSYESYNLQYENLNLKGVPRDIDRFIT